MTRRVCICDYQRTAIGRWGGRWRRSGADDLAMVPVDALTARNPSVDSSQLDRGAFGAANQPGEDTRNLARMVVLLSGHPETEPG